MLEFGGTGILPVRVANGQIARSTSNAASRIAQALYFIMREVQDYYFKQAKKDGYVSRAAYKLIEIDDRKHLLRKGSCVLDCGSAPGSWLQVASRRVGPRGSVVGIDLQPVSARLDGNTKVIVGDFTTTAPSRLRELAGDADGRFDVVLSDMAPNTSGDPHSDHFLSVRLCDSVLNLCPAALKPGGHLVMKVFEGAAYRDLIKRVEGRFEQARGFKPKASRSESVEMFIVAMGFVAEAVSPPTAAGTDAVMPQRKPSTGWAPR